MGGVKNTGLVESLSITSELQSYSMLSLVNKRSAIVDALELLRRSEKAIPTCENKRSTVAEVAGQPKYCRAMTDTQVGKLLCISLPPVERIPLRLIVDLGKCKIGSEFIFMRTILFRKPSAS